MKQFPSNKNMIISIIVLLVYFNISFFMHIDKHFVFRQYNWHNEQKLDSVKIQVFSATRTRIKISFDKDFPLPAKYTYALQNDKKRYYFRFEYLTNKNGFIDFYDVHWLKDIPANIHQEFLLIKLILPLKQDGKKTVVTIGDENFCRGDDEFFRKELAQKANLKFVGKQRDVIGYSMMAKTNQSSKNILHEIGNTPKSNYLILLFNWHPERESLNSYLLNLSQIKNRLRAKQYQKIFWIVPPASNNKQADRQIIETIDSLQSDKILIINPYKSNNYKLTNKNGLYSKKTFIKMAYQIAKNL